VKYTHDKLPNMTIYTPSQVHEWKQLYRVAWAVYEKPKNCKIFVKKNCHAAIRYILWIVSMHNHTFVSGSRLITQHDISTKDTCNGFDGPLSMDNVVWGTKKRNNMTDNFLHHDAGQYPTTDRQTATCHVSNGWQWVLQASQQTISQRQQLYTQDMHTSDTLQEWTISDNYKCVCCTSQMPEKALKSIPSTFRHPLSPAKERK